MNCVVALCVLVALTLSAPSYGHVIMITKQEEGQGHADEDFWPSNAQEYPQGFWFGVQDLMCVRGVASPLDLIRVRRGAMRRGLTHLRQWFEPGPPRRASLVYRHRLVFYAGQIYEWGQSMTVEARQGSRPLVEKCPILWETFPAEISRCGEDVVANFTGEYLNHFGRYSLITNNCHHFANRLVSLLASDDCQLPEAPLEDLGRHVWSHIRRHLDRHLAAIQEWKPDWDIGNPFGDSEEE